jgi:hypothetical protein
LEFGGERNRRSNFAQAFIVVEDYATIAQPPPLPSRLSSALLFLRL